MTKRLFIAIPLPKSFRNNLDNYAISFPLMRGLRWTPKQNMHITVQFLGDTDENNTAVMIERLESVAQKIQPFELEFEHTTFAPPHKEPRMVWGVMKHSADYAHLVGAVSDAIDEFVSENLHTAPSRSLVRRRDEQVMRKERIPHITLARLQKPVIARSMNLAQPKLRNDTVNVASFELWESQLTPEGPHYSVIQKISIPCMNYLSTAPGRNKKVGMINKKTPRMGGVGAQPKNTWKILCEGS